MKELVTIEVMSEKEAVKRSLFEQRSFAMISITTPGNPLPAFSDNPNMTALLRLCFNDTDGDYGQVKSPCPEDFKGLKDFIDRLDAEVLFIHCGAGISRSSAVAAAVSEYVGVKKKIFDDPKYIPNRLVYRLAKKELGIDRNWRYFEEIFNVGDEK